MAAMAEYDDNLFGPQYGDKFDFTLRFEHIIFTILPASILITAFPVLLYQYTQKPVVIGRSWSLYAKLASAICLLGLEFGNLALWTHHPSQNYSSIAIVASALSCTAVCCIIGFLYVEHYHSLQPSSLLSIYLTIGILLDAAKARSCLSRGGDLNAIGSLLAVASVLKGVIVVLEEIPKEAHPQRPYNIETTSGFWSRATFLWVNKILFYGYSNVLNIEDLEPLGPEFSATHLHSIFTTVWKKAKTTSSHCLIKALLQTLMQPICAIIIPRLCHSAFIFSQPLLIKRIIIYVETQDPSINRARGLIGATILIYMGIAISRAVYMHLSYRLVTLARGVLVSHILAKTLRIEYSEAGKKSAMSLMSTDIDGLVTGLPTLHDIWVSFIEVGIGAYLLTTVVGKASFLVVFPLIISTAISVFMGSHLGPARKLWNDKIQDRVTQTASLFKYTKGIKMLAIESPITAYIQSLRVAELQQSKSFRLLALAVNTTGAFAESITPVIVIGGAIFWATASDRLTPTNAFTSLTIIYLISTPLLKILNSYSSFASVLGCVKRIQAFLLLQERQDRRTDWDASEFRDEKASVTTSIFNKKTPTAPQAVPDNSDIIISGQLVSIISHIGTSVINNASFNIRRAALTIVTGPVASGKTVLLQALLGEVAFEGTIMVNPLSSLIAYCGQVPWICNISIRQNIIQGQIFDQAWYASVLNACLLVEDLSQLADGDETLAGSDGAQLSGGQKQRIALARALYSRAPVMVLDDVLRGLDAPTSTSIFHRLFGGNGLLRALRTTVIMTSHSALHSTFADQIIFLDGSGNVETRPVRNGLPPSDRTLLPTLQYESAEALEIQEKAESEQTLSAVEKAKKIAVIEAQEDLTLRRRGNKSLYNFYFQSTKAWVAILWIFLLILSTAVEEMPAIYIRIWLEVAPNNNLYFIGFAAIGVFACITCTAMFLFFYLKAIPDSANSLHEMVLRSVMGATLSYLTETDIGVILNRFSQDMSLISQDLPRAMMLVIYSTGGTVIAIGVIASGARYMALTLPLVMLVIYVVQHFYLRTSRQMRYVDLEAKTPLYTHILETATGLHNIRALGLSEKTQQAGFDLLDMSQKPFYYMFCIQRWLTLSMDLTALGLATTLVSFSVMLKFTTSETAIGLSLLNMTAIGSYFSRVILHWTNLETSLGAISRVMLFLKHTPQEPAIEGAIIPASNWPQSGHIVINNLSATYSSTDIPNTVLHNISLEIRAGQRIVLLGRTGSGKSSLILTLLNFLDYSGTIFIDGADVAKTPQHILRSRITTITQDSIELGGTIRYNLLPFKLERDEGSNTVYDADLIDVLCRVRLWDYIVSHGGLDALLSDLVLSSGQIQLISIARAVLHNRLNGTKIVLMDEPTSSLDLETDRHIQREIFSELFGNCTVIMVAHRLETIRNEDVSLVVEMAEGMIIRTSRP